MNKKAFTINCHAEFISASHEIPKQVRNDSKRVAFTLAEVLITLTIIGVIAAITIPNLMQKYQQKALESSFKSSLSLLQNTIKRMTIDMGNDIDSQMKTKYTAGQYPEELFEYMKTTPISKSKTWKQKTKTFNGKNIFEGVCGFNSYNVIAANGMGIGVMFNCNTTIIDVDTNGDKGPNRIGYDHFVFHISSKDTIVSYAGQISQKNEKCNLTDESADNGNGCTRYALLNKCPWDKNKTYWECLK